MEKGNSGRTPSVFAHRWTVLLAFKWYKMKKKVKILIGVSVAVLLVAILTITLVIVLRKEEWIVLEKSFSSLNEQCTPDWSGNSDWRRKRCKMPLICAATGDQKTGKRSSKNTHHQPP